MAKTPFSILLLRRLSSQNPKPYPQHTLSLFLSQGLTSKPFSTSATPSDPQTPKPSNLSARLSFVFDQIDQIEKDRSQKDETLQRIRAWRQSKNVDNTPQNPQSGLGFGNDVNSGSNFTESSSLESKLRERNPESTTQNGNLGLGFGNDGKFDSNSTAESKLEVEVVHPWPEWIELMERLVQQNYFDHRRKDEDQMLQQQLGFDVSEGKVADDAGVDFRDFKTVQTACLNFGKDRFDILRSLSRSDIQILVGYGCPSVDKKVVFSAKLLRKHVHLDEGDVCSSCSLRSSCERAYLLTNKEDEARTIDIMRGLLTFGFDPVNGSVVNKFLMKQKSVKTVVRKLLHEVVKLSAVPIDPNLPPPVIKRPPPKVKQPPPPPKKRVGRDDIEMKKGDWLCPKCDFMNFAKNTVCLQCDAKRPKRQLLPGEWECPECNFLNYRRNMACFHCECKRPADEFIENKMQERQRGPRTRLEKIASRPGVSNAWNFDFDDNESDGADVASFENADSSVKSEDSLLYSLAQGGDYRSPEDDFNKASRVPSLQEREYSEPGTNRSGMGFDDFDDEEDNVDSYEVDTSNPMGKASLNVFSDVEGYSEHEDIEGSDDNLLARHRTSSLSYNKPPKAMRRTEAISGSDDDFDSDKELSVHPNWRSSHVADPRQRTRGRGPKGSSRGLSFGSDEEQGLHSDTDDDLDEDFGSRQSNGKKMDSGKRDFRQRGISDIEDEDFGSRRSNGKEMGSGRRDFRQRGISDIEDEDFGSRRGNGKKMGSGRRDFRQRGDEDFGSRRTNGKKLGSGRRDFQHRGISDIEDGSFSGSESDNDGQHSHRNRFKGNKVGADRRGKNSRSQGDYKFTRDSQFRSKGTMSDRRDSFNDGFNRSSRGSRGNSRGFQGNDNLGRRMNDKGGNLRNFKGPRQEGFGNRQRGRFNEYKVEMDKDIGEFRNSRRVIER